MNVRIERTPIDGSTHKTRLLKGGLVRHASAPARPQMKLDRVASRRNSSKHASTISPHPSNSNARTSSCLPLNELAIAHSVVSRLRLERDEWRATAQIQERQLLANERDFKRQERNIALLEHQNDALRVDRREDVSANQRISARLQDTITKHDKLLDELNDSLRVNARLKRSDRAKGKVVQRNLRLKATLQRYTSQAATEPDVDTEAALMESLALANERIGELESKGSNLLQVLDKRDDAVKLGEAGGALREAITDEDFKVQKEHWANLLEE